MGDFKSRKVAEMMIELMMVLAVTACGCILGTVIVMILSSRLLERQRKMYEQLLDDSHARERKAYDELRWLYTKGNTSEIRKCLEDLEGS